jgi:hypothetical protein
MITDKIKEKVLTTEWNFADLLKLDELCNSLSRSIYNDSDLEDLLRLAWDTPISSLDFKETYKLGDYFEQAATLRIRTLLKEQFQIYFENAKVSFNHFEEKEEVKPIISESAKIPEKKEKKKEKGPKDDTGISMPKGVKRV